MFLVMVALATGTITPAKMVRAPITIDDWPTAALESGLDGFELVRLLVSPAGRVTACEIVVPSPVLGLDAAACKVVRRAKMTPATDQDGKPAYGSLKHWVAWSRDHEYSQPPVIDVTVLLNRLPARVSPTTLTKLALVVDAKGQVEACSVTETSGFPALDTAACSSGVAAAEIAALKDASGAPVRSVQPLNVAFAIGGRAAATGQPTQSASIAPHPQ